MLAFLLTLFAEVLCFGRFALGSPKDARERVTRVDIAECRLFALCSGRRVSGKDSTENLKLVTAL